MIFLNLIWFVIFFGWFGGLIFYILGSIFRVLIITKPLGDSLVELSKLLAFPFGKEIIREKNMNSYEKKFNKIANIIWFPLGILSAIFFLLQAIGSFFLAIIFFIFIITIPFSAMLIANGIVYAKLSYFIISPLGLKVMTKSDAIAKKVVDELKKAQ
jgi:uncharacterized membrane protein YccF (DUF307 family)